MAPKDKGGVVNKDLNVYGVKKLKVAGMSTTFMSWEDQDFLAGVPVPFFHTIPLTSTSLDLSICPENVGANTNNTALMIGEKAAAIIAQELGLEV
ncbi:hypothetical protein MMC11_002201 [Xylographa trunciseda]|nr:hypothetical protein [Xylographa trunciseda]